ncbi:MAG TPA: prepilin peptidase [Peptococcaceae bacterium]|nr:prepilin peptidase [Peptococcaceae bacterium]
MTFLINLYILIAGLLVGSFLNVCIYRIPRRESIAFPPSHCTACGTSLKPLDLVPLFSYLFLRGKCRYCGDKISPRYFIIESVHGLGWLGIALNFGTTLHALAGMMLFSMTLVISAIDLEHGIIPDGLSVLLLGTGIVYHFLSMDIGLINRLLGMAVGFGLLFLLAVISKGGMGGGDIKLCAGIGFWLGFPGFLYALMAASIIGSIVSIALMALKRKGIKETIPFGPFLMIGFLLIYFYQSELLEVYWDLILSIYG